MPLTEAFIGMGSNLGARLETLAAALSAIEQRADTRVLVVSEVVETEPWGITTQPLFANAVARIETQLAADELLDALKGIEARLGRRSGERFGPRAIDLDILLFGRERWSTPTLIVPHPRLAERAFALLPLLDIAPHVTGPDGRRFDGSTATEGRILRSLGGLPGYEGITVSRSEG